MLIILQFFPISLLIQDMLEKFSFLSGKRKYLNTLNTYILSKLHLNINFFLQEKNLCLSYSKSPHTTRLGLKKVQVSHHLEPQELMRDLRMEI